MSKIILRGELVNNLYGKSDDWAKIGKGRHLEPGLCKYDAVLNDDGSIKSPEKTYLLTREAIAAMRPTAAGKPIIGKAGGFDHMSVTAEDMAAGKYDGDVIRSYDGGDGWEWIDFTVRNAETKEKCRDGYQFSCAYTPVSCDGTPGVWHNIPFDETILNAEYGHFAIVPVPRYEGATIELQNSIGGKVNETLKSVLKVMLGTKAVRELANAMEKDEKDAKKAKLKADFENAFKNAKDEPEREKLKKDFENAMADADKPGAAADAASEADKLEKLPLGGGDVPPDLGVAAAGFEPQAAVGPEKSAAEVAKAEEEKANAERTNGAAQENFNAAVAWSKAFTPAMLSNAVAEKVLTNSADKTVLPYMKQGADVKAAWLDAYRGATGATVAERCNSLKANAEKAVELRNAIKAKAEKDAAAEAKRTELFNALKRSAEERGGLNGMFPILGETVQDKQALGQELYG